MQLYVAGLYGSLTTLSVSKLTWKHLGGGSLARTCAQAEGTGKAPPGTAFIPTPGRHHK